MSLNGNLEHFPIIDIIQLLNGTRKSGILRLICNKGESQLVFHEGDLVSANFLNSRVRIGQVLVSAGAITEEQLSDALDIQKNAGDNRKPLVITLLDHEMVNETAAYNGIESLIEMTVVEVLTWKEGRFTLEVSKNDKIGNYHFSRTKFPQRILLNSQGILMESLRIFDEKVRDGTMDEILSIAGISNIDLDSEQLENSPPAITSNGCVLNDGPSVLQNLLEEQRNLIQNSNNQNYRTVDEIKKLIVSEFPSATKDQKRQLIQLLTGSLSEISVSNTPHGLAVIVITQSLFLSSMIKSICFQEGIYSVSTENITSLDINIRLLLCQMLHLIILIDVPHDNFEQDFIKICKGLQKYKQASIVLVSCARFWDSLGLETLSLGIRSIIPRPCKECSEQSAILQAISFCSKFGAFLQTLSSEFKNSDEQRFFTCISRLRGCKTRTEITVATLSFMIEVFERAIVFLVTESELIAEHSFGIKGVKDEGVVLLPKLHIPLDDQEIIENVIKTGQMYYGFHSDSTWPHELYRLIGRPDSPEVLLFPFIRANTVVAFIYADFGKETALSPSLHYFDALVQYTTAQISVSAYRQKLKSILEENRNLKYR